VNALKQQEVRPARSLSNPEPPKKENSPTTGQKNNSLKRNGANAVAPTPANTENKEQPPKENNVKQQPQQPQQPQQEKPKQETAVVPNNGSVSANSTRPSALTSVIYPVLSKLLKSNQEEGVIAALAQLKIAFDNAERAKPGITHSLIAQIIETLKR